MSGGMSAPRSLQRGGFVLGLVVGLLVGLVLALGVALYITKTPVPFIDKVPQRTAAQDSAEAERNRNWDPNAALGGAAAQRASQAASAAAAAAVPGAVASDPAAAPAPALVTPAPTPAPAPATAARPGRDPAAILSGQPVPAVSPASATAAAVEAFVYFVQAGAYTRADDAEQQRARLALGGFTARVSEREQAGRTVYRVRIGPFGTRGEADTQQQKLVEQGLEAQIVRVEKP